LKAISSCRESKRPPLKTPGLIGSRIKVHNTDGSRHVEEITDWDVEKRIAVRFQEFQPPLSHFADHFLVTWEFKRSGAGTEVTRRMSLVPSGLPGALLLPPISLLMKKSLEKNLARLGRRESG
jgi:hypothetical protein